MIITKDIISRCLKNAQKSRSENLFLNESDLVSNFALALSAYMKREKIKLSVRYEFYTDTSTYIKNNSKSRFDLFIIATKKKVVETYIFEFKYIISHNKCALGLNIPCIEIFMPVGSLSINLNSQAKSIEKDLKKISSFRNKIKSKSSKLYGFHITVYNENGIEEVFNQKKFEKYKPDTRSLKNVEVDISKKFPQKKYKQIIHTLIRAYIPLKKRKSFSLHHLGQILSESTYPDYSSYWYSNSDDAVSEKIFNLIRDLYEQASNVNAYPIYREGLKCTIIKC